MEITFEKKEDQQIFEKQLFDLQTANANNKIDQKKLAAFLETLFYSISKK